MRLDCLVPPIALLLLAACASPPDPAPETLTDPALIHGRAMAERFCSSCHAIDRADHGHDPEAPPFRSLSERYPVDSLAESLVEGMMTGHETMPEFQFTAEAAADFIAWLEHIQTTRPAAE